MKFEKFVKSAGVYGKVVKTMTSKWLVFDGVGMKIPVGVNVFGEEIEATDILEAIFSTEIDDDSMDLVAAEVPADGKASDIVRVFQSRIYGDTIKIGNDKYGLLEKQDRLNYLSVEDDDEKEHRFILITDCTGEELVGFITGKEII